jgi:PAS domain S-box-containing protein
LKPESFGSCLDKARNLHPRQEKTMSPETETQILQRENQRLRNRCHKLEARYRTTLDSISEIYFETDRQGRLTFFNQSFCQLTGFSHKTLLGRTARDLCPLESALRLEMIFRHILEKGETQGLSHVDVFHKDGHTLPLEISVSPIRNSEQETLGFRGIARDISLKILAEKERATFAEQMQQAEKLEAIGTLAAGIAHDFNNLLMGIQGNISLLMLHTEPDTPAWKRLVKMEAQIRHGAELTRQLLGFSEDDTRTSRTCNLNILVQDTLAFFSRTCKNICVHPRLSPDLKPVMADASQIRKVILAICVNAASHAMPQGGDLYVETDNILLTDAFVQPHRLPSGEYVRIRIRDTGAGMDEKTRKRVFDPFFTTLEKGRGTGLGLASAFSIIKHHQGILSVQSLPGEGCTFFIHLPCTHPSGKALLPPSRGLRILLVDDEEMVREVAADLLEELGHKVITASGGKQALTLFDQHAPTIDLVILDMVMPGMDGNTVLTALRKKAPDLAVLISSGYGQNELAKDALSFQHTGFIQKPFTLAGLSQAIRQLIT